MVIGCRLKEEPRDKLRRSFSSVILAKLAVSKSPSDKLQACTSTFLACIARFPSTPTGTHRPFASPWTVAHGVYRSQISDSSDSTVGFGIEMSALELRNADLFLTAVTDSPILLTTVLSQT